MIRPGSILTLASYYERRGMAKELLKLEKASEALLIYYLNQVPVTFAYRYADTPENRKRNRAGKLSGFRTGVRNENFIPSSKRAKSQGTGTRYYDQGRQNWRSWRRGHVVSITSYWSVEQNQFVDTPEEAGLVGGVEYTAKPKTEPVVDEKKLERTRKKEQAKQEREKLRQRLKQRK